ncbi:hypothetical protein KIL84_011768 [Mauremys mutica]|uniref:Uncharacterized protein n=1 Tax=Mauremys mutica TaxID=74926 RepID=A0A9D4B2L6_9SAUR|nr:hypothetical protein KIL84_011768 [Mauremys mutica]
MIEQISLSWHMRNWVAWEGKNLKLKKIAALKGAKQTVPGPTISISSSHPAKRKVSDTENQEVKRTKGSNDQPQTSASGLPRDFFDKAERADTKALPSKGPGPSLLTGDYDDEEEEEVEEEEEKDNTSKPPSVQKNEIPPTAQETVANALPAGNFGL